MPKYVVTLEERITYDVTVEADNADNAMEAADEVFVQSERPFEDFHGCVQEREACNVEELTGEQAA